MSQSYDFYRLNIGIKPLLECESEEIVVEILLIEEAPNVRMESAASVLKGLVKTSQEIGGVLTKISFPPLKPFLQFFSISAVTYVLGFFLLNYQAYFQVLQYNVAPSMAANSFQEVIEPQTFQVIKDPELEKKNIPPLQLEIPPTENRIIIPKLGKNIPIMETAGINRYSKNWDELEKDILRDLKDGVVHYPGTAQPGQKGNVVITGHSSYYPWDEGKYKDVFALLGELEENDEIIVYHDQNKYFYRVKEKREIEADDIEILQQPDEYRLTLMTCTPLGTNLRRLIVTATLD